MKTLLFVIAAILLVFNRMQTDSPHGSNFKISCGVCHSSKSWKLDKTIYSFDHNKTKLPLVGQHTIVNCRQCHPTLVFSAAKTNCIDCHKDLHQSTVGPDCSRCHTPASWLVNNISDIHQMSRFPLLGAHRSAECAQCHKSESLLRFDVPGVNCVDCHRDQFLATTNPNHVQSGFSEDCASCHPMTALQWTGAGFNHNIFPLVQGHSGLKCTDCHTSAPFTATSPLCYSCHQQQFLSAKNPDHLASGFATTCQDCHSLNPGWTPATFDHSAFPLTLGHSTPTCNDCHKGNYKNTSTDCYSCHQATYTATNNPNHQASGIGTVCSQCHTTNPGWTPAKFAHTNFAMTLGHANVACDACHKGNYTNTSTDCYSCHLTDYNGTTNPNHRTAGIPTTCALCHTTNPGWAPATFTHTGFALTLGHANVTCDACHKGNYTTTSTDCFSCHATDYNNTTNPNHKTLNFSTTCTTCHTTNPGWTPATYTQHDTQFFPIYSGRHKGVWTKCSDCHTNPSNYLLFDCIHCHTNAHPGKNYTNAQCYQCHPRGSGG